MSHPHQTMFTIISSWFTPTIFFCLMNLVIATIFFSHKKPAPEPNAAHPLARTPSLLDRVRSINFSPYNSDPAYNPTQTPSLVQKVRSFNFSPFNQDRAEDSVQGPSLLQRAGSINLNLFNSKPTEDPTHNFHNSYPTQDLTHSTQDPTQTPSLLQRVRSIKLNNYNSDPTENPSLLQRVRSIKLNPYNTDPTHGPTRTHDQPDPRPTHQAHQRSGSEPGGPKARRPDPTFEEAVAVPARMRKSSSVRTMKPAEVVEERRPATMREKKVTEGDEEVDGKADDFINKFKNQLKLQRLNSILRYKEMLNRGASM